MQKIEPAQARSFIVARTRYNRPLDMDNPVEFESWEQTVDRAISHQQWLWERQLGTDLDRHQLAELDELRDLMYDKAVSLAGRTLWLGGTAKSREVECSQFNCSYTVAETVHDIVDIFWLLLNGCGVGFKPVPGCLFGFASTIPHVEYIEEPDPNSTQETNYESYEDGVWLIKVGDSARAWAKFIGKLIAGKHANCRTLLLDFSGIRPPGGRLKGYGWICNGAKPLIDATRRIVDIMQRASERCLSFGEIHDIVNLLGTVLSSRRSAQIALCDFDSSQRSLDFMTFKDDPNAWWRGQSNNSFNFHSRPSRLELDTIISRMIEGEKGEPGIRNQAEASRRCPWSSGTNPCFAPETLIHTKNYGTATIESLYGKTIEVFGGNGELITTTVEKTGTNQPLLTVTLSDGLKFRVTHTHTFLTEDGFRVQAKDLFEGLALKLSPFSILSNITVQSVEDLAERSDVYCFTVLVTNNFCFNNIVIGQCGEILLPNKGFCNLVEINIAHPRFIGSANSDQLLEAVRLVSRANYRQTCVNLNDGILQRAWHENNSNIRLCGVGLTGLAQAFPDTASLRLLRLTAHDAADQMAYELGTPRSQAVTTVKPSGTLSKVMNCSEGMHDPISEYIFNNVNISNHDPILEALVAANYRHFPNPYDPTSTLVTLPVHYNGFTPDRRLVSAVGQLDRYLLLNTEWADHNVSCTIYYDESEKQDIIDWLWTHWDSGFLAVSFLPRKQPRYEYLPQVVVDQREFDDYMHTLRPITVSASGRIYSDLELDPDCSGGACPIR